MRIRLYCQNCGRRSGVSSDELCRSWEEQREAIAPGKKYALLAVVDCMYCHSLTEYDSPIFAFMFGVLFDDYLASKES